MSTDFQPLPSSTSITTGEGLPPVPPPGGIGLPPPTKDEINATATTATTVQMADSTTSASAPLGSPTVAQVNSTAPPQAYGVVVAPNPPPGYTGQPMQGYPPQGYTGQPMQAYPPQGYPGQPMQMYPMPPPPNPAVVGLVVHSSGVAGYGDQRNQGYYGQQPNGAVVSQGYKQYVNGSGVDQRAQGYYGGRVVGVNVAYGGYPQQAYPQQAYPQQAYPQQAYPQQAYPPQQGAAKKSDCCVIL